ncbi:hypothetical protein GGI42DRAFT_311427 [Trichoderma sp. SZMC 28013]
MILSPRGMVICFGPGLLVLLPRIFSTRCLLSHPILKPCEQNRVAGNKKGTTSTQQNRSRNAHRTPKSLEERGKRSLQG